MAQLTDEIWPDVEYEVHGTGEHQFWMAKDWQAETDWMDAQLANQPDEGIVGCIVSFPVADGKAFYKIVNDDPLILAYIMSGDCYTIPDAHVRGLERGDIERMVQFDRDWKSMAEKRKQA